MQEDKRTTIRIGHISDLHLPLVDSVGLSKMLNKRVLGYANLRLLRGKTHLREPFERLIGRLSEENLDHLLVTGDLTNLALDFEFKTVSDLLKNNGFAKDNTTIIPGNHDRYTFGADFGGAFERGMKEWLPDGFDRHRSYPIVRDLGPVKLIALDTATWRGPHRAAGVIGPGALKSVFDLVSEAKESGAHPVIAMHHPPFILEGKMFKHYRNGLAGAAQFQSKIGSHTATVLHGHIHVLSRRQVGALDVIGVPSASNNTGTLQKQLAYNIYEFDRSGLKEGRIVRHYPDGQSPDQQFVVENLPNSTDH